MKKLAQSFNTAAQDSNPGSLSREFEALPVSHCTLQQCHSNVILSLSCFTKQVHFYATACLTGRRCCFTKTTMFLRTPVLLPTQKLRRLLDERDTAGNTPLHYAAIGGQPSTIGCLLGLGAALNVTNNLLQSPLHLAAR